MCEKYTKLNGIPIKIRTFVISMFDEPMVITIATKSLGNEVMVSDLPIADELANVITFYISDEVFGLSGKEICEKHLVEPLIFITES